MGEAETSMKKLGHHAIPTDNFLIDSLRRKVCQGAVDIKLPVIERNLYSGEPWEVLKDNDPWDVLNPTDKATDIKRVIFVFTDLKPTGKKRFVRTAGAGTWHGSTAEKPVRREDGSILMGCCKSYLDFRLSKNPESREKGHWMMHEYKLKGLESMIPTPANINTVLCQITHVVNKDLGIHRAWPKSPFEICFRNFKSQRFFEIRPNKRQEPSAATADDQQIQQPKRRKLEASTSADEQQVAQLFDDMIDLTDVLDMPDFEQIENDSQMVVYGDEDDHIGTIGTMTVVTNNHQEPDFSDLVETTDGDQQIKNPIAENLDHDEYEEYANQLESGLMEPEKNRDQNLVINNNLDHAEDGKYANNLKSHFKESDLSENEKNMVVNAEESWAGTVPTTGSMVYDDSEDEGFNAEEFASLVQKLPAVDEDTPPIYKMHIPLPWEDDGFP